MTDETAAYRTLTLAEREGLKIKCYEWAQHPYYGSHFRIHPTEKMLPFGIDAVLIFTSSPQGGGHAIVGWEAGRGVFEGTDNECARWALAQIKAYLKQNVKKNAKKNPR